ncbi:MAG: hypothetical protein EHM61_28740, partial [Acidobacteria bacterium]
MPHLMRCGWVRYRSAQDEGASKGQRIKGAEDQRGRGSKGQRGRGAEGQRERSPVAVNSLLSLLPFSPLILRPFD